MRRHSLDLDFVALGRMVLRPTPRSANRAWSPARVSQKREYLKYSPETIGDFALRLCECGDQRPNQNRKKAAIGGHICGLYEHYLQLSDCLADLGGFELAHSRLRNAF
jgi:hypothetical protein